MYRTALEKLDEARKALGGQGFDMLGKAVAAGAHHAGGEGQRVAERATLLRGRHGPRHRRAGRCTSSRRANGSSAGRRGRSRSRTRRATTRRAGSSRRPGWPLEQAERNTIALMASPGGNSSSVMLTGRARAAGAASVTAQQRGDGQRDSGARLRVHGVHRMAPGWRRGCAVRRNAGGSAAPTSRRQCASKPLGTNAGRGVTECTPHSVRPPLFTRARTSMPAPIR